MATTLDYQTPSPTEKANRNSGTLFWAAFALSGIIGAPFGDWVIESWYYQPNPDGGGLFLSCVALISTAALLLIARVLAALRIKSPLIAIACGLFGPLAGLMIGISTNMF